jgi:hypothetical protein
MSRDAVPFDVVLWIRIGFIADPAVLANADSDADPDPGF